MSGFESNDTMAEDWSVDAPEGVKASFYPVLESTNLTASHMPLPAGVSGCWVIAGQQRGGRGRRGRHWESPPGNLYASLRLETPSADLETGLIPFAIALAVRDCALELGAPEGLLRCKWPNDVLADGRKIAGILIEAGGGGELLVLLIGIGVNLVSHPQSSRFPSDHLGSFLPGAAPAPRTAFRHLSAALARRMQQLCKTPAEIVTEWRAYAWGMGEVQLIATGAEEARPARLIDVQSNGGLIIERDDGKREVLYAGDVFALPMTGV